MKLPKKTKPVFTGKRYIVHQWEQELFDGSKTIFEGVKRIPSVQIIHIKNDSILLLKEKQPVKGSYIAFPGGVIEEGETAKEAAKREFQEETGYKADSIKRLFRVNATCIDWETTYFSASNIVRTEGVAEDPGESINAFHAERKEFINLLKQGKLRNKFLENAGLRYFGFESETSLTGFKNFLVENYSSNPGT